MVKNSQKGKARHFLLGKLLSIEFVVMLSIEFSLLGFLFLEEILCFRKWECWKWRGLKPVSWSTFHIKPERISNFSFSISSLLASEDKKNSCFRIWLLKAELQGFLRSSCYCALGDDGKPPAGGDSCFSSYHYHGKLLLALCIQVCDSSV